MAFLVRHDADSNDKKVISETLQYPICFSIHDQKNTLIGQIYCQVFAVHDTVAKRVNLRNIEITKIGVADESTEGSIVHDCKEEDLSAANLFAFLDCIQIALDKMEKFDIEQSQKVITCIENTLRCFVVNRHIKLEDE